MHTAIPLTTPRSTTYVPPPSDPPTQQPITETKPTTTTTTNPPLRSDQITMIRTASAQGETRYQGRRENLSPAWGYQRWCGGSGGERRPPRRAHAPTGLAELMAVHHSSSSTAGSKAALSVPRRYDTETDTVIPVPSRPGADADRST
ncbi:hypothetical protein V491_01959 [Pseudogymnoascus sp. VKM F-3775]|nr:hypothetical protein V491_01959 [Pseudogymnoascus sp. VKM F-3775]